MSVITAELAALAVHSRYDLVLIASRRVRELRNGHAPYIAARSSDTATALTEIEQGKVTRDYLLKNPNIERESKRRYQ